MDLNIDKKIAVALRRIIMQNIPHYCFNNIIIDKNDTLLDNDHLKKRIINIPIEILFIDIKTLKEINDDIIVNNDFNVNIELEELKMVCSKKYDSDKKEIIQSITTDDCTYFLNDKKITNPYKQKIKIVDLKYTTDNLEFTAITDINIPVKQINYSISETPILVTSNKTQKLSIFPILDNITSKDILQNAIYILKVKLNYILNHLKDIDKDKGRIIINNDLFTLGYLLSYFLNKDNNIEFCSLNIKTLIEKNSYLNFVIKSKSKKNIYEILNDILKEINNQLKQIVI